MKKNRSRWLAMLLTLILILSVGLQGTTLAFGDNDLISGSTPTGDITTGGTPTGDTTTGGTPTGDTTTGGTPTGDTTTGGTPTGDTTTGGTPTGDTTTGGTPTGDTTTGGTPTGDTTTGGTPTGDTTTGGTPTGDTTTGGTPTGDTTTGGTPTGDTTTGGTPTGDTTTGGTPTGDTTTGAGFSAAAFAGEVELTATTGFEFVDVAVYKGSNRVDPRTLVTDEDYIVKGKVKNISGITLYNVDVEGYEDDLSSNETLNFEKRFEAQDGTHMINLSVTGYGVKEQKKYFGWNYKDKRSDSYSVGYTAADAQYLSLSLETIKKGSETPVSWVDGMMLQPGTEYTVKAKVGFVPTEEKVTVDNLKFKAPNQGEIRLDTISNWWNGILGHPKSTTVEFKFTAKAGGDAFDVTASGQRKQFNTKQEAQATLTYQAIAKHEVSFAVDGGHGTLAAAADAVAVASGSQVTAGTKVTFTAASNDGYRVKVWKVNGVAQDAKTAVLSDVTISKTTNVTVAFEEITNASIFITGDDAYDLYVNGENISDGAPFREKWNLIDEYRVNLEDDYLIAAKVWDTAKNITGLHVTIKFDSGMEIIGNNDSNWRCSTAAIRGWNTDQTMIPPWAKVVNVTHTGWNSVPGQWIWSSQDDIKKLDTPVYFRYTGTAPANTYTVGFSVVADQGGTLTAAAGSEVVASGNSLVENTSVNFAATPAEGWQVKEWKINGVSSESTALTQSVTITENTVVTVEYEQLNATIFITADDDYELYVDGVLIGQESNPQNSGWKTVEAYGVVLSEDSIVAVRVNDRKNVVAGLSVKIVYDDETVITKRDSNWRLLNVTTDTPEPDGWKTAATVTGWSEVTNVTYDSWDAARLAGAPWTEQWVWTPNYDASKAIFDTHVLFRYAAVVNDDEGGGGTGGGGEEPVTYTVTFDSNDGSAVEAITDIEKGGTVTLPTEPKKDGFVFGGWFKDDGTFEIPFTTSTQVDGNITVHAKWNPEEVPFYVHVYYEAPGATGDVPKDDGDYSYGNNVTVKGPGNLAREGYTFAGWKASINFENGISALLFAADKVVEGTVYATGDIFSMDEADVLLTAQWEEKKEEVVVIPRRNNGGRNNNTTTTITPEELPLAVPVVEGASLPTPVEALQQIVEDVVPLGVPVLPKTGEIPATLFYGLGGILAAAGVFLKRK